MQVRSATTVLDNSVGELISKARTQETIYVRVPKLLPFGESLVSHDLEPAYGHTPRVR